MKVNKNKGFLLFTIGPVQSYIETARKTQDLYMGSYMISYLIFDAINLLLEDIPAEDIIFPAVNKDALEISSVASFPNRFLTLVPREKAEDIASRIEAQIKLETKNIAKYVSMKYKCNQKLFLEQKPWDFWEIYWVVTYPKPGESYGQFYERTEKSLGAVKNLRWFSQSEEHGSKCSLCGQRQVVTTDDGDGLCSVCMIKRKANKYFIDIYKSVSETDRKDYFKSFPSTAEIATAKFKEKLFSDEHAKNLYKSLNTKLKETLGKQHINKVQPIPKLLVRVKSSENYEGQWLYEENIDSDYIKRQLGLDVSKEGLAEAISIRNKLVKHIKTEPGKYYAVISMDGDDMGKWLSGGMAKDPNKISKQMHWGISQSLLDFNKKARNILDKEYLGRLVYAGGDDVFALMNTYGLLEAAIKLRDIFPKFEKNMDSKRQSTASMGICISYYKDPLAKAINRARAMEQKAKDYPGKDAIAISYITSSGQEKVMVCSWSQLKNIINLSETICNYVSQSFAKNLWLEFSKITTDGIIIQEELQESFKSGILRRLYRSKKSEISSKEYEKIVPNLYKRLVSTVESLEYDLKSFFNALEIINVLGGE